MLQFVCQEPLCFLLSVLDSLWFYFFASIFYKQPTFCFLFTLAYTQYT